MQQNRTLLLCTRMLDERLAATAAESNLVIESVTFIETKNLQADKLAAQLLRLGRQPLTAVFTSMHAVQAVAAQIPVAPSWKIFCTGGITQEYCINFFGEASIIASAKNAALLAEKIITSSTVQRLVFFCGDQRLNDLPEILNSHGRIVDEMVVYTTEQTPVCIEKDYAGILFFSPSAVHSFFSVNTISTEVILFSIGNTTTAAINSYCSNKVVTGEWPGAKSMIELVTHYYRKQPHF